MTRLAVTPVRPDVLGLSVQPDQARERRNDIIGSKRRGDLDRQALPGMFIQNAQHPDGLLAGQPITSQIEGFQRWTPFSFLQLL